MCIVYVASELSFSSASSFSVDSFGMASYNYYYDLTLSVFQAATPSSQSPHHGNLSVNAGNVMAPPT